MLASPVPPPSTLGQLPPGLLLSNSHRGIQVRADDDTARQRDKFGNRNGYSIEISEGGDLPGATLLAPAGA